MIWRKDGWLDAWFYGYILEGWIVGWLEVRCVGDEMDCWLVGWLVAWLAVRLKVWMVAW